MQDCGASLEDAALGPGQLRRTPQWAGEGGMDQELGIWGCSCGVWGMTVLRCEVFSLGRRHQRVSLSRWQ